MIRSILAVVAGLVVAWVVIMMAEVVNILLFPLPEGIDMNDMQAIEAAMMEAPAHKLILVPIGWFLGTLLGATLAGKIARRSPHVHALILGSLLLLVGIFNLTMICHPAWFWPVGIGAFLLGGVLPALMMRPNPKSGGVLEQPGEPGA